MRYRRMFLFVLLSSGMIACSSVPHADQGKSTDPTSEAVTFTIVTLNLWHDKGDWPHRRAIIVDSLRESRPDAIFLQEVLQDENLPNQAVDLAQRLGYEHHFVSIDPPTKTRRYGNAVLTRHPVLAKDGVPLQPSEDYRVAGLIRAEIDGHPVNFYVTHLNFTDKTGATRARQIRDLLAFVDATHGDTPSVIAGDFNVAADAPELAPLRARFTDAFAATHADANAPANTTLNPHHEHPPQRIDHVFLETAAFEPVETRIILDQPDKAGVWASDHFGMWARFRGK